MTKRKRRSAVEDLDTHSSESDTNNDLEDEYDTPSESDQGSDTFSDFHVTGKNDVSNRETMRDGSGDRFSSVHEHDCTNSGLNLLSMASIDFQISLCWTKGCGHLITTARPIA